MPIKPLAGLTRPLRVLLTACVVVSTLAVAADLYVYAEYAALPAGAVFADQLLASDAVSALVAILQFGLLVACAVVFLMWAYRANKNLRARAGIAMRFTPGWTVVWFFIPIACVFKPYQALKEIWLVSHGTTGDGHAVVGWWWFLFVLSSVAGNVAFRLSWDAQDTASFLVSTGAYAVADTIDAVGYAVTLIMVLRVAVAYAARIDETAAATGPAYGGVVPAPSTAGAWTAAGAALPPAAWHPDPAGRHQLRWWDGAEWSRYVADSGVSSEDPL